MQAAAPDASGGTARVAVIGCGAWGRNLVRTHAGLGSLAAVVDADPDAAAAQGAQHGVPARSVAEVLADPDIDAVVIAAPAADHAGLARQAIAAGKHLFVEKPLALTVDDAEAVVREAADAGRVLMVGHLLQYHPAFLALRDLVVGGRLGELRYLYSNRLNLGRIRQEENSLWSFAPHDLSMLLALVGEEPHEVTATGGSFLSPHIADVTTTHLAFPSGPQAHVFVSWLHPFKEQRLVVVGADAMAVFDDTKDWDEKLVVFDHGVSWTGGVPTADRADPTPVPLPPTEPLRLECQHFLDCVATGSAPRTDGVEGLRVLRVLARAQEALELSGPAAPSAPATGSGSEPAPASPHPGVHASAVVDPGVVIGAGTKVWHFSHLLTGTTIGADCTLGQNVVVGPDVVVGDRCRIQNNVSVYAGVTLEDGVFCGPSCVFTNVYNPRAEVSRKDEFRTTVVRRGATIGANATIVCGNEIGEYAFIGAGAVVNRAVPAHALVVGTPARQIGWMSHDGERLDDDLVCPRSGRRYAERDGILVELIDPETRGS
ncbi:MAG: Gfo/Idh/MocA family oxidoreductase [Actinobacteria bacterium]|nr:Gfo/Idh/MocA family oxidoreductase [Actinomycetota bacterium]